jgi:hypothetical protein
LLVDGWWGGWVGGDLRLSASWAILEQQFDS